MKAVVYRGPYEVAVEDVPDATIEEPLDALIRITTTNICGSDLHMYEGRHRVEEGKVLGHENMGIVEEVGAGVDRIKVGDRVSVPFNIACGTCRNCTQGWTSFCLRTNPTEGMDGAGLRLRQHGPLRRAARPSTCACRSPTSTCSSCPPGDEHENDFTMLSDIFPTGWHGTVLAGVAARATRWPSSAPARSG